MIFLGDFHIHHKDWLTYSGGTDCPDELCYNFSISNNHTQTVNFPTQIPVTITVLPFLISFFLLMLVFFSTMAFPELGNSDPVVASVSMTFHQT